MLADVVRPLPRVTVTYKVPEEYNLGKLNISFKRSSRMETPLKVMNRVDYKGDNIQRQKDEYFENFRNEKKYLSDYLHSIKLDNVIFLEGFV